MPDITGILSAFKKELFSGRYMIVIFTWLLILILSPNNLKDFISNKADIPYSFQLLSFSFCVLLYSFTVFIYKKTMTIIKDRKSKKRIRARELEIIKTLNLLNTDEQELVRVLLNGGSPFVVFTGFEIPDYAISLVNKGVIIQIRYEQYNDRCYYSLDPLVMSVLRENIKNKVNNG